MKIAILGAGNLGLAIAKGLIVNNAITSLYLTKRSVSSIENYADYGNVFTTTSNKEAVEKSDIILLAVQPRHLEGVLHEIKDILTEKHVLISTVTGFKIPKIEAIVGSDQFIVRAMPNTAISVGKSMTCICSNEKGKKRVNVAMAIFKRLGNAIEIPEEQMQAATVICASGIAFWMRLIRATTQGAIQLGFESNEALEMSMHTCLGAASLLVESGHHPEQEIDRVTTPGGCTIEGLNEMEHEGLSSSLIKGLIASFDKINQISKS
ncbi:pyrroline-5-carboxylate reductase [Neptunitalea chrysea]|uniref:Pyrroline-5-carboxylate reductase n=1 Tax=Neptunitalea chrysea TaxID=1647581 RepID=A0A9W6B678_9FLAO|nr:pyrroline-5-carboxylate reductase [Neptunitalea chrysea]GLB52350.1 pyrroline-5-carboxylate reductase [Neptunitalea chrysea]